MEWAFGAQGKAGGPPHPSGLAMTHTTAQGGQAYLGLELPPGNDMCMQCAWRSTLGVSSAPTAQHRRLSNICNACCRAAPPDLAKMKSPLLLPPRRNCRAPMQ